jgi:hypothetical protein
VRICREMVAATGEWYAEPRGKVRDGLLADWRSGILKAPADQPVGEILKADSELAHDWLCERTGGTYAAGLVILRPAVEDAVSVLNQEQRRSVLRTLRPTSMLTSLASTLVGEDLDLYRMFLQDQELTSVHLWPLAGRPTHIWPEKAKLALAAGFSPEDVAGAAYSGDMSWAGAESAMWNGWAEQFAELRTHEDAGIRTAAEIGQAYAQQQKQRALEEERREDIYGR